MGNAPDAERLRRSTVMFRIDRRNLAAFVSVTTVMLMAQGWWPERGTVPRPAWAMPSAQQNSPAVGDRIQPGTVLHSGDMLKSPTGCFVLIMQTDGNLVLYGSGNVPLWHAGTHGHAGARAELQTDGNFVVRGADDRALWNSGTQGRPAATLRVQNDGNLVIYDASDQPLWASYSVSDCDACSLRLLPSEFDRFAACTAKESTEGPWIVDGDIPIYAIEDLQKFYNVVVEGQARNRSGLSALDDGTGSPASALFDEGLAVPIADLVIHRANGVDARWPIDRQCGLTYCVSTAFGANHARAIQAMEGAAADWSSAAGVRITHVTAQDASCTPNSPVDFDVRPISGQRYLARAFFPNETRDRRNVMINDSAFTMSGVWTLRGVLRHELGHALGFRHEHTRPESGTCFEDNQWRPLTPYDRDSVMHYPQCNGGQTGDLVLTVRDIQGAQSVYGVSAHCDPSPTATVDCDPKCSCQKECQRLHDACIADSQKPGGPKPGFCAQLLSWCRSRCH